MSSNQLHIKSKKVDFLSKWRQKLKDFDIECKKRDALEEQYQRLDVLKVFVNIKKRLPFKFTYQTADAEERKLNNWMHLAKNGDWPIAFRNEIFAIIQKYQRRGARVVQFVAEEEVEDDAVEDDEEEAVEDDEEEAVEDDEEDDVDEVEQKEAKKYASLLEAKTSKTSLHDLEGKLVMYVLLLSKLDDGRLICKIGRSINVRRRIRELERDYA
jgi:hypothetical protein